MKKYVLFILLLSLFAPTVAEAKKKKYDNGDVYIGVWKKGMPNELGEMTYANGDVYNGNWEMGVRKGAGVMIYANGDKYEGEWAFDYQEGVGQMTYANGDKYDGSWGGNMRLGRGNIHYSDGGYYEGEWAEDKMSGEGVITYSNGDTYSGHWKSGKYSKGIMTYSNGEIYDGNWSDNKFHGDGTFTYANKDKLISRWVNGERVALGKMIYYNGDIYEGDWDFDQYNGEGSLTLNNGDINEGVWVNGILSSGTKTVKNNGNVNMPKNFVSIRYNIKDGAIESNEIKYTKGFTYVGDVNNYHREGSGIYQHRKDDSIYSKLNSEWRSDMLIKGYGTISKNSIESKFEITCLEPSENKYKVVIYKADKVIYSEEINKTLDYIYSSILYDAEEVVAQKLREEYYNKYLKNAVFMLHVPVNDHPNFQELARMVDFSSLTSLEHIVFNDCNTVSKARKCYVDKRRLKRSDRGFLLQQTMYAEKLAEEYKTCEYTYEDGYIIIDDVKYRFIPSDKVLFDEKNKVKLKQIHDFSEIESATRNMLGY